MTQDNTESDFTPPSIEEISELLPSYEIHSFIAKGGMGAVYKATQRSLDRPVAIKILPRHFGEDAEFRTAFQTEAKCMAKFNHPNLISIFDFGQVDGLLYIIMELVEGESLFHYTYGKTLPPSEAAQIIYDICQGLANAHKQGILHRDIKPANILLDSSNLPKIGDFGLARPVGEDEGGEIFGTPGYTAPEVIHDPQAVDESTDIYSVGAMLYELLTGELPSKLYIPASSRVQCSPQFDKIIQKAMHPSPAMRFRSAEDLAEALKPLTKKQASFNTLKVDHKSTGAVPAARATATLITAPSTATLKSTGAVPAARATTTLVTPPSTANLKSPATARTAAATPATPPLEEIKVHTHPSFIRNIIIIIVLLVAIVIAWEGKKKVEANRKAQKELIAREKAEKKEKEAKRKAKKEPIAREKEKERKAKLTIVEKPKESLYDLKARLTIGLRTTMPEGTITHSGRARLYVPLEMTWQAAQDYCESYGGHLPILPYSDETSWLSSKIKSSEKIWLGSGSTANQSWAWIDGSQFLLEIPKPATTNQTTYLALDKKGTITPLPGSEEHTFFIEWLMDGTSPATIELQLERCKKSISAKKPIYPVGSIAHEGNAYYLINKKEINWINAKRMAKRAGGNLAVPYSEEENKWILDQFSPLIEPSKKCWIGGFRDPNGSWKWVDGAAWTFATWGPNSPSVMKSFSAACAITHNKKWQDLPKDKYLDYALIKWTSDKSKKPVVASSATDAELKKTQQICAKLVRKIQGKYDDLFDENVKTYLFNIRAYQRGLSSTLKAEFGPAIEIAKTNYKNHLILEELDTKDYPTSQRLLENHTDSVRRQQRLQAQQLSDLENIRIKYRQRIQKLAEGLKSKGLKGKLQEYQQELKNTSEGGENFIKYILHTEEE